MKILLTILLALNFTTIKVFSVPRGFSEVEYSIYKDKNAYRHRHTPSPSSNSEQTSVNYRVQHPERSSGDSLSRAFWNQPGGHLHEEFMREQPSQEQRHYFPRNPASTRPSQHYPITPGTNRNFNLQRQDQEHPSRIPHSQHHLRNAGQHYVPNTNIIEAFDESLPVVYY